MQNGPVLIDGSPGSEPGRRFVSSGVSAGERTAHAQSDIRLTLPARADNVVLVRHVASSLAEALALPPALVEDIRLAVTEACTNVVRHAYVGREGVLEVELAPEGDGMVVVVTDTGRGLRPNPSTGGAGLGLPLMAALAAELEINHGPESGSRVRMSFRSGE